MKIKFISLIVLSLLVISCSLTDQGNTEGPYNVTFHLYKIDGTPGTGDVYIDGVLKGSGKNNIVISDFEDNKEYIIRCDMIGTHDQWLILRHSLQGQNKVQKGTDSTDLIYNNYAVYRGEEVYLLKVPEDWNMEAYTKYLDPTKTGMKSLEPKDGAVLLEKRYVNGTDAENTVNSFIKESNNAQISGDFTEPRRNYYLKTEGDGAITIILENIKNTKVGFSYGTNGSVILDPTIALPGSNNQFDTTTLLHYWVFSHIAENPSVLLKRQKLINFITKPIQKSKFEFTPYMKRLWLIYSQFDAGIHF